MMGQRMGVKPARSMMGWDAVTRKASVNVLWRSGLRSHAYIKRVRELG